MRWMPLPTRIVVGVGVTALVVGGAAAGAQAASWPASTNGTAAAAAAGPAAAPDGTVAAGTAREQAPTAALKGLGRLRRGGPTGQTLVTVTFRKGVRATSASGGTSPLASTARGHDATRRSVAPGVGAATYTVPDAEVNDFIAATAARPEVASAKRANIFVPLVTPTDTQYAAHQRAYLTAIAAPAGWDYGRGNAAVKIAVVDSGVDVGHPDLAGKVVAQYNAVNETTDVTDGVGHGTFVAGVAAAATNNAAGIAGVGFDSSIIAIKVADAGGTMYDGSVAAGIRKAADLGAKVINLSLGSPGPDNLTRDAVAYARGLGALVVAAAGNSAQEGNPKFYPAAYPGVLSVGATNGKGQRAWFSQHGSWVSMAAPGMNIRGTTPRTLDPTLTLFETANYDTGKGTSFAAPMVAGAAALLAARSPGATATQLRTALVSTAKGFAGYGLGTGQLDVARAMAAIAPTTTTPTMTAPAAAATLTGQTSLVATSGVAKGFVGYFVDGTRVGLAASGVAVPWFPHGWANGTRTLEARDCTAAGVCATSGTSRTVTLAMAAPVITAPVGAAALTGSVTPTVTGSTERGVAIFVDGVRNAFATTKAPELNLASVTNGSHTLEAVVCDLAGTRCDGPRSAPVTVTTTSLRPVAGTVTNPVFSPNADGIKDTVSVRYTLPGAQRVRIVVRNSAGVLVRSIPAVSRAAGSYAFSWNGRNNSGAAVGSGAYTVRIETSTAAGLAGLATAGVRLDKTRSALTLTTATGTTFYPSADGYRDVFTARATVNEAVTLNLSIKNSRGRTVRTLSTSAASGARSLGWNGRTSAGPFAPAGTYTWTFTATDAGGTKTVSAARTVVLSTKRLATFTKVYSKTGRSAYAIGAGDACVTSTDVGSAYPTGLWLKNSCPRTNPQIAAAWYKFAVPAAVSITSMTVATAGRSHSQPAEVLAGIYSTQIDEYDLTWPSRRVTVNTGQTITLGTITGPGHAPKNVADVVVFVPNDLYGPPLTDWDIMTVRLTVKYRALV